jgi:hypothetical protein
MQGRNEPEYWHSELIPDITILISEYFNLSDHCPQALFDLKGFVINECFPLAKN